MDWDKLFDLFQVALMAKCSISVTELTREADQQNPRVRLFSRDLDENPANKKVISILYLSLGEQARNPFMAKEPHTALWDLKAQELIALCTDCFRKKRGTERGTGTDFFQDTNSKVNHYFNSGMP